MADEREDAGEPNAEMGADEGKWWVVELLMWVPELFVAAVRIVVGIFVALLSSCS